MSRDGIRRSPAPSLISDAELTEFPQGVALRSRRTDAKGSAVVEIVITLPDGRKTTRTAGTTRKKILEGLKRVTEELQSSHPRAGGPSATLTSRSPLGEVARSWRRQAEVRGYRSKRNQWRRYKPTTLKTFDDFYAAHLAGKRDAEGTLVRPPHPILARSVGKISTQDLRLLFEKDWAGLSDGVKAKLHQILTHIFRHAVDQACILGDPMSAVDGYDSQGQLHDDKYLTLEQMKALLSTLYDPSQAAHVWHADYYLPHIKTLLYAGLRLNEMISLRWEQVVFSEESCSSFISVVGQLEGDEVVSPKSRAGVRSIYLTDDLVADLRAHRSDQLRHFDQNAQRHGRKHGVESPEPNPLGLVFTSPWGRPLSHRQFRKVLREIGRAAKIPELLHPHYLRHTALTYLADCVNGNAKVFHYIAGHANRTVTDRYVGVPRGALIEATKRFQRHVAEKVV